MPELAEVEFFRRVWMRGASGAVVAVETHPKARPLRDIDSDLLRKVLLGTRIESSSASGKQLCFRFTGGQWLGVHLGMTGELRVEAAGYEALKHDHLVMHFAKASLVFADPRMFGRLQHHTGAKAPEWWSDLPPDLTSNGFNGRWVADFLARHPGLPLKAVLLLQDGFVGVGNWMADEILWRAGLHPQRRVATLSAKEIQLMHAEMVEVARQALETIAAAEGKVFGDPPAGWLFHARWGKVGLCPRDGSVLQRDTVGGRTTAWCDQCQPMRKTKIQ
jgi:formamidopyrimidine-DNA glycosylase